MVQFTALIKQFQEKGEKTGWTYIEIPAKIASSINPNNKKTFRVKGKLDSYAIKGVSLLPMGNGNFIMAINAIMRKGIKKRKGATVLVQLSLDTEPFKINRDFMSCLEDDPPALKFFKTLAPSMQKYFSKWIESAKTEPTKTKRIAQAVSAMANAQDFGQMVRNLKQEREKEKRG